MGPIFLGLKMEIFKTTPSFLMYQKLPYMTGYPEPLGLLGDVLEILQFCPSTERDELQRVKHLKPPAPPLQPKRLVGHFWTPILDRFCDFNPLYLSLWVEIQKSPRWRHLYIHDVLPAQKLAQKPQPFGL